MSELVKNFLENATVQDLKDKLNMLNISTTGTKPTLKLRLEETIRNLSVDEVNHYFSENLDNVQPECPVIDNNNGVEAEIQDNADEPILNNQLDDEIERLRQSIAKKQEIARLKQQLALLSETEEIRSTSSPIFHFKDIEESMPSFSGDDNFSVHKWFQMFEEMAETLSWDLRTSFIYAKRLMTGTAKMFLRSVSLKSWIEFKSAVIKEFNVKVSAADIHNQLKNRKKKRDETWLQYVFSMQL